MEAASPSQVSLGGRGAAEQLAQQLRDVPTAAVPYTMPTMLPEVTQMMTLVDCKTGVMLQNSASVR